MDFRATNEIGDTVYLHLCIEITGQHSNIILMQDDNRIIDAVKRVDETKSSYREVLPGVTYVLPPKQNKVNLLTDSVEAAADAVLQLTQQQLSSAFLKAIEGISPIVSRELAFLAAGDCTCSVSTVSRASIVKALSAVSEILQSGQTAKCVVFNEDEKPMDFSFMEIQQYGNFLKKTYYDDFSTLLDQFYFERDASFAQNEKQGIY